MYVYVHTAFELKYYCQKQGYLQCRDLYFSYYIVRTMC